MDPTTILATIAALGLVVKAVVDWARRRWPRLDGGLVQGAAWILGAALAAAFDVRGAEALLEHLGGTAGRTPHYLVDWLLTGGGIAAGAGFLAEITGRSGGNTIIEVDAEGRPVL